MAIQPSRLSDFIDSGSPEAILVRLRGFGLLSANATDDLVLPLIRGGFDEQDEWASADTLIAGQLSFRNLLSEKGREWFADKTR